MWWALWCAVVVAGGAGVAAAPAPDSLTPLDMVQMDSSAPDDVSNPIKRVLEKGFYFYNNYLIYFLNYLKGKRTVCTNIMETRFNNRLIKANTPSQIIEMMKST